MVAKHKFLLISLFVLFFVTFCFGLIVFRTTAEDHPSLGSISEVKQFDYDRAIVMHVLFPTMTQSWESARLIPAKDCKLSGFENELENLQIILSSEEEVNKDNFVVDLLTLNEDSVLKKCLIIGTTRDGKESLVYLNNNNDIIEIMTMDLPRAE